MSGIIRVDNEGARLKGWVARVWDQGPPTKYFSDVKHGGKRSAYWSAERWLFWIRAAIDRDRLTRTTIQGGWAAKWKAAFRKKEDRHDPGSA